MLNFAYAEVLELKEKFDEVHALYNKFLDALRQDLEDVEARVSSANTSNASAGAQGSAGHANGDVLGNSTSLDVPIQSQNLSFVSQTSEERSTKSKELAERRTEFGVVWIMYMRFSRRAEGLKAWRSVFKEARKDRWTPWEVYEAAGTLPDVLCVIIISFSDV